MTYRHQPRLLEDLLYHWDRWVHQDIAVAVAVVAENMGSLQKDRVKLQRGKASSHHLHTVFAVAAVAVAVADTRHLGVDHYCNSWPQHHHQMTVADLPGVHTMVKSKNQ